MQCLCLLGFNEVNCSLRAMMPTRELAIFGVAVACAAGLFAFDRAERERREAQILEQEQQIELLHRELLALSQGDFARPRGLPQLAVTGPADDGRPGLEEGDAKEAEQAADPPDGPVTGERSENFEATRP